MRDEQRGEALLAERVDRVERLRRRVRRERDQLAACSSRSSASARPCGEPQSAAASAVGRELALRREQQMDERRRDRAEDVQQRALRASRRSGSTRSGAPRARRPSVCTSDVAVADVRELVREDAFELRRRRSAEQPALTAIAGSARPAPGGERPRVARPRSRTAAASATRASSASRSTVECSMRRLAERQLARAEHPEQRRDRRTSTRRAATSRPQKTKGDARGSPPSSQPSAAEHRADADEQQPGLEEVPRDQRTRTLARRRRLVVLASPRGGQSSSRRVAAARAVERGDVLERHEDVPVQLDVRDVLDVAVRRQHAFLVLAAEERHLDLLALVLVGVVLHGVESV